MSLFSPLYVYAIAGEPLPLDDLPGIMRERLFVISSGACHAIAGEMDTPPPPDADTLRAQDALVRQLAARAHALLPARFGSQFADAAAVRQTIEELRPRLEQALARVRGCEQMTIRLLADRDADTSARAPGASSPSTARDAVADAPSTASATPVSTRDAPGAPGAGTQYLRRRAAEARQALPGLDELRARLAAHVTHERIELRRPPDRAEGRSGGPTSMIGSIHHLIPRGTAEAYRAVLENADTSAALAARGVRIRVSGPSPPYAFAEVTLP